MAKPDGNAAKELLSTYSRELAVMRTQQSQGRLALVLGAGFSDTLNFPSWDKLREGLAESPQVSVGKAPKQRHLKKGEALYQSFRKTLLSSKELKRFWEDQKVDEVDREHSQALVESFIDSEWLNLITSVLYSEHDTSTGNKGKRAKNLVKLAKNKYAYSLIQAFAEPGNTIINYNFDDSVELILTDIASGRPGSWHSSWTSGPKRITNKVNVYHPNGFLPGDRRKGKGSTAVTLLESAFQSQIHETMTGSNASSTAFFLENTCLFVGVSFDDPTLTHYLSHCARIRPGHIHFTLVMVREGLELSQIEQETIRDTLLTLYNLVPIFLPENSFSIFAELLTDDGFARHKDSCLADENSFKFVYYVTGCVSSGKSSVLSHLTGFSLHGEWEDDMPESMKDDPNRLQPRQIKDIDKWVDRQIVSKNIRAQEAKAGLNVFDRCPLDALAFKTGADRHSRAKQMRDALGNRKLVSGTVFVLIGEPYEMCSRSIKRNKGVDQQWLKNQQDAILDVYSGKIPGIHFIDTRGRSLGTVVQDIIKIIFSSQIARADLDQMLLDAEQRNS